MEKPQEEAWVGLQIGLVGVLGNHQGRAKGVNKVDGDSSMAPVCICTLGERRAQGKTMTSAGTFVWKKLPFQPLPLIRQFSSYLYDAIWDAVPMLNFRASEPSSE